MSTMSNFTRVRDDFLQSLPQAERRLFATVHSSEQMLDEISQWEVIQKQKVIGVRLLSNIKRFSDGLQPYLDAIQLVDSSGPKMAASAWGALRLVLKLATNFASFFEKLTDALERLGQELPVYEQLAKVRELTPSPRLERALQSLYSDLFALFSTLVRITLKKDGTSKNQFLVSMRLCWKPFDSFFDDILRRFGMHADIFRNEVLLEQLRLSSELEQAVRQQRIKEIEDTLASQDARASAHRFQETTADSLRHLERVAEAESLLRIQQWISPPDFATDFDELLQTRAEGTSGWLLKTRRFKSWFSERYRASHEPRKFGSNVFWIHGNPGCGKTVLAVTTIETLQQTHEHVRSDPLEVYYFIFRYGKSGLSTSLSAYRGLLAQILRRHWDDQGLIDKFIFVMQATSHGQARASMGDLKELLNMCLHWLGDSMLVFDGADECEDLDGFVADLVVKSAIPGVKMAIFSRPTARALLESVPENQQLSIGRSTSQDIEVYLNSSLSDLVKRTFLPKGSDTCRLASQLTRAADGMFLWAHLMVTYLNSYALTPQKRQKTITEILHPEGLEIMYNRITNLIYHGPSAERNLAKRTIAWLSHCRRMMASSELLSALMTHEGEMSDVTPEQQILFERALLTSCGGLIEREVRYSDFHKSNIVTFRFIHLSVMEFFSEKNSVPDKGPEIKSSSSKYLSCTEAEAHVQITWTCLRYLTYFVPAQPLGGAIGARTNPIDLRNVFPFIAYAAIHWILHLAATLILFKSHTGEIEAVAEMYPLLPTLAAFLHQKCVLMAWIESTYTFGEVPCHDTLRQWTQALLPLCQDSNDLRGNSKALLEDLFEFSDYLESLDLYWTRKLMQSPECLWEEVTAFTPSRFLPKSSSAIVESVTCLSPERDDLSSRWLTRISETSSSGNSMFVLTVWPSKLYETTAAKGRCVSRQSTERLCSGWKAIFEIFRIAHDAKTTLFRSLSIPLAAKEIKIQINQSLWFEPNAYPDCFIWKVQFPLAIAADGMTFSILRTIYRLRTSKPTQILSYDAAPLPLDAVTLLKDAPARHDIDADAAAGSPQRKSSSSSQQRVPGIHVYWVTFSHDGKQIFYSNQSLGAPRNIALFGVTERRPLEVVLLNDGYLTQYDGPGTENLDNLSVTFHPHHPVVAFSFLDAVYLWTFGGGPYDNPKIIYDLGENYDLKFSDEGNTLTLSCTTAIAFVILPLPEEILKMDRLPSRVHETLSVSHSKLGGFESNFCAVCPLELDLISRFREYRLAAAEGSRKTLTKRHDSLRYPIQVIRGSYSSTSGDGTGLGWIPNISDGKLDLRMWAYSHDFSSSSNIELSKLPNWPGITMASFSVKLPQWDNPLLKVVMNKRSDKWSDMATPADEHLPAILLRPPEQVVKLRRLIHGDMDFTDMTFHRSIPSKAILADQRPKAFQFDSGHHYIYLRDAGARVVKTYFVLSLLQESMSRKQCNAIWIACNFVCQVQERLQRSELSVIAAQLVMRQLKHGLSPRHEHYTRFHSSHTQLTRNGTRHRIKVSIVFTWELGHTEFAVGMRSPDLKINFDTVFRQTAATVKLEVYSGNSIMPWCLSSKWTSTLTYDNTDLSCNKGDLCLMRDSLSIEHNLLPAKQSQNNSSQRLFLTAWPRNLTLIGVEMIKSPRPEHHDIRVVEFKNVVLLFVGIALGIVIDILRRVE